jgi:hypothetical protein
MSSKVDDGQIQRHVSLSSSVATTAAAASRWSVWSVVFGLSLFIACLSFKPSEPYLSEYLICNADTQTDTCKQYHSSNDCNSHLPCLWSSSSVCGVVPCANVTYQNCGNDDFNYCQQDHTNHECDKVHCYKHFTEDEVNNDIYPWSTYAYLPFLLLLGPFAEIVSYKQAILFGILGRVATRLLLIYGTSLWNMQLMQAAYSLGTAAEDGEPLILPSGLLIVYF